MKESKKEYYFMRKPEVVDAKEYEQEGGYVTYYSKPREWQTKRQYEPAVNPSLSRQRKVFYIFNILFIIAAFWVWQSYDVVHKGNIYENEKENLIYIMEVEERASQTFIEVYIKNAKKENLTISKTFDISFFYSIKDKHFALKDVKTETNTTLSSDKLIIGKYKIPKELFLVKELSGFGVLINNKIALRKKR